MLDFLEILKIVSANICLWFEPQKNWIRMDVNWKIYLLFCTQCYWELNRVWHLDMMVWRKNSAADITDHTVQTLLFFISNTVWNIFKPNKTYVSYINHILSMPRYLNNIWICLEFCTCVKNQPFDKTFVQKYFIKMQTGVTAILAILWGSVFKVFTSPSQNIWESKKQLNQIVSRLKESLKQLWTQRKLKQPNVKTNTS